MADPKVSICMPYHSAPLMLSHHYAEAEHWPEHIREAVEIVVCDDCSATPALPPADGVLKYFQLWRMDGEHIPWSHRCATNIAAHYARGRYVIITDIDHVVPVATLDAILGLVQVVGSIGGVFTFDRQNFDGSPYKSHPDSWFMSKDMWNYIGGYDERYRGVYGQNRPFIDRVNKYVKPQNCKLPLVRVSRDDIPDASMPGDYPRKSDAARSAIAALMREFQANRTFYKSVQLTAQHRKVA